MHYLNHNNSKWEKTNIKCPRDNEPIYRETFNNGIPSDHFCCGRSGCTYTTFFSNQLELIKLDIERLNSKTNSTKLSCLFYEK